MMRYTLSRPAAIDLYSIDDYISRGDPRAAERVIAELEAAMNLISRMPGMGHVRPSSISTTGLRFFSVGSYLIVYLPDTKPLQIVRVLHHARDIQHELAA